MNTTSAECAENAAQYSVKRSRRARRQHRAWVVGAAAALCTALLPGITPHASADSHADRAYVANADGDTVSVIDLKTKKVTDTIAVGDVPVDVAVDLTRSRAYVTNAAWATTCR